MTQTVWCYCTKCREDMHVDEDNDELYGVCSNCGSKRMKVVGVVMGWDLQPHIGFINKKILWSDLDRVWYSEYFQDGYWPTDPMTHEKLPIYDDTKPRKKKRRRWWKWMCE